MEVPAREARNAQTADLPDGERFAFGDNWRRFLRHLDDARVREAEESLQEMLGQSVADRSFLDIGCGSGLFSLAALRLGASRVHSVDFDAQSVACALQLRQEFAESDPRWTIEQGDVLDAEAFAELGQWDIVYSWGVLHHTGNMWAALEVAQRAVSPGGTFFISIYNDQGARSRLWRHVKKTYNRLPPSLRAPYALAMVVPRELLAFAYHCAVGKPLTYLRGWSTYKRDRGMDWWHDTLDWVGGYPFEVAKPEEIFGYLRARGFTLERLTTCAGGLGCNEYVLTRGTAAP